VAKDDQLYVPITLAAYYDLRRSEVIGVEWSNIDFDAKRINIWHKVIIYNYPKDSKLKPILNQAVIKR